MPAHEVGRDDKLPRCRVVTFELNRVQFETDSPNRSRSRNTATAGRLWPKKPTAVFELDTV
jgi:hypothetical protein